MDQDPNGEILETPAGSQPGTITADEGNQVNPEGALNPSSEEATWNSLKGSAQERFRNLAKRANQIDTLQQEITQLKSQFQSQTHNPVPSSDIQDAVAKLDQVGVATKSWSEKTIDDKVDQRLSGLVYNMEMDRLESKHSGSDGLPAFDRAEYEAYLNQNPQYRNYTPEDVYEKIYEPEIFDYKVSQMGKQATRKSAPTLRSTRTRIQEETMTPEYIEKRLQEPDGRQWYDQNIQKINAVIAKVPSAE